MALGNGTPATGNAGASPSPLRDPAMGRRFRSCMLQFPKYLETGEVGGDTTCGFGGVENDDINAIRRILEQNWSELD